MATSDAQKKARDKWNAKYVELRFRVTKERKEEIQNYATSKGESLSALLNRLVDEAMEQDK
ncbi:antitoxin [Bengtsoniella intestinalis]|uniref:antitoxin n=1 Tax=Bengtsoniella intestinalis TaxID=3073143 RepID=UPI00391EF51A